MKKNIIFLAIIYFLLTACTDSFLVVNSEQNMLESNFYSTTNNMEKALVAAYDPLKWPDWYNGQYCPLPFTVDVMSDDVLVGGSGESDMDYFHLMRKFSATPLKNVTGIWAAFYTGINRANIVIEKMPNVTDISAERKDQMLAEAHALRAYYYTWLWKFWGNIPYFDVNINTAPYSAPQITADALYAHIITDIDYALASTNLTNSVTDVTQKGRITKDMIRMLKAEVVLYQKDASKYAETLTELESAISSGRYSLADNFATIFTDAGEWNSESIWEINYTDQGTRDWASDTNPDGPIHAGGTVFPMVIGINSCTGPDYVSGWGFEPVAAGLYNAYETGDQRKDGGILNFAAYKLTTSTANYVPRYEDTGYFNLKYLGRQGYSTGNNTAALNFRNNLRIYRYSEMLLYAAELQVRTSGSGAQAHLDELRNKRFGVTDNSHSITATLDNVITERRLELALEGKRFWDLVRCDGDANVSAANKATSVLGSRGYTNNKKYLPIPQSEIDKSESILTQNPY